MPRLTYDVEILSSRNRATHFYAVAQQNDMTCTENVMITDTNGSRISSDSDSITSNRAIRVNFEACGWEQGVPDGIHSG